MIFAQDFVLSVDVEILLILATVIRAPGGTWWSGFTLIKMNTSPTTDTTITNCCRRRAAELQDRVTAVTFHL